MRLPALIFTALLLTGLAGCGQKGPLYLPQPGDPSPAEQQPAQ